MVARRIEHNSQLFGVLLLDKEQRLLRVLSKDKFYGTNRHNGYKHKLAIQDNGEAPTIKLEDLAIEIEHLTIGKKARAGNADRARVYESKHKILGTGLVLDIVDDEHIYLIKAPKGTGVFEIPDFITGYHVNGLDKSGKIVSLATGPFSDTQYSEIRVKANLPVLDYLFYGIESSKLSVIFNNSYTYSMQATFSDCYGLQELTIQGLNTSYVINMIDTFRECSSLVKLDVSCFRTPNVESTAHMFAKCYRIGYLDLSNFNLSSNKTMFDMFGNCRLLRQIDFGNSFFGPRLEDMTYTFKWCMELEKIKITGSLESLTDMRSAFDYCGGLLEADLSECKLPALVLASSMFYKCIRLKKIDFGKNRLPDLKFADDMFYGCSELATLNMESVEAPNLVSTEQMFNGCEALRTINLPRFKPLIGVGDSKEMFADCGIIDEINFGNADVEVAEYASLFKNTMVHKFSGRESLHRQYKLEKGY